MRQSTARAAFRSYRAHSQLHGGVLNRIGSQKCPPQSLNGILSFVCHVASCDCKQFLHLQTISIHIRIQYMLAHVEFTTNYHNAPMKQTQRTLGWDMSV